METLLLAFLGSLASGLTFNVRGYKLIFTGLSGLAGFLVYRLLFEYTTHPVAAIFIGAVAVGIYSESAARLLKAPSTVFSIPGILPLVPGIAAYETIQFLMDNDLNQAIGKIIDTAIGAGAIAFGILLITAIFRFTSKSKKEDRKSGLIKNTK